MHHNRSCQLQGIMLHLTRCHEENSSMIEHCMVLAHLISTSSPIGDVNECNSSSTRLLDSFVHTARDAWPFWHCQLASTGLGFLLRGQSTELLWGQILRHLWDMTFFDSSIADISKHARFESSLVNVSITLPASRRSRQWKPDWPRRTIHTYHSIYNDPDSGSKHFDETGEISATDQDYVMLGASQTGSVGLLAKDLLLIRSETMNSRSETPGRWVEVFSQDRRIPCQCWSWRDWYNSSLLHATWSSIHTGCVDCCEAGLWFFSSFESWLIRISHLLHCSLELTVCIFVRCRRVYHYTSLVLLHNHFGVSVFQHLK